MNRYIICEREIILNGNGESFTQEEFDSIKEKVKYIDCFEEKSLGIQALVLSDTATIPLEYKKMLLREYFHTHSEEESFLAFRAKALYEWRKENKYCSSCGTLLAEHPELTARKCPHCGKIIFPRISPCIIVVVQKEGKVLLARHTYRNQDMYACIAGFMEAGESAEHAVEREVLEETGIKIKNIKYRGSQSWPFPDQLMLGFTADWESGNLVLQKEEIADAQWFDPDNCPSSPKPGSIAYTLIHKLYKQ